MDRIVPLSVQPGDDAHVHAHIGEESATHDLGIESDAVEHEFLLT